MEFSAKDSKKLYELIHGSTTERIVEKIKDSLIIAGSGIKGKHSFEAWEEAAIALLQVEKMAGMSKERIKEIKDKLYRAGILDENGEMDEPYRNDN